jgi:thymidylate synthase (FAD)
MTGLRKWADEHQYDAEPQPNADPDVGVLPTVHLLHMPDDPLGVLAAQNGIYKGKVVRSLAEITDDERVRALDDMMKTTLQSPLEAIKMHFVIEGVDRAFTHQMVRQRTANFGQESLRFAVMGDLIDATTLPPELHNTERTANLQDATNFSFDEIVNDYKFTIAPRDERNRMIWDWTIMQIDAAYHYLAEHGIAAEEARGLLPHCTATRLHWQTDMRGLMKVMGERLCTQAQFHWRMVAALVQQAIRTYTPDFSWAYGENESEFALEFWEKRNRWQFELISESGIFRPVCYHTRQCMFMASADRGCTIRERVELLAANGVPSEHWHMQNTIDNHDGVPVAVAVRVEEWAMNHRAARKVS